MIAAQQFREDLFYRLSMIELKAPSLLERDGDLPLLTRHFVARFASQFGKPITGSSTVPSYFFASTIGQGTSANSKT